jgi:hypothetical protein
MAEGDGSQSSTVPLALLAIEAPDYADTVFVTIPIAASSLPDDPAFWARHVFDIRSAPRWVVALLGLRQVMVGVIGVKRGSSSVFDVDRVEDGQALIFAADRHLDFAASVSVDTAHRLLAVTTSVRLHGWRGRIYFAPVSVLHGPILRAMARRAVQRVTGTD